MILIGLNGKIGSGKSTVANYLSIYYNNKNYNVHRLAFAEPLKQMAIEFLGLSRDDCYTQEGKSKFNKFWGMTNREILQRIGTEAFRKGFHKDTWTKILELQITNIENSIDSATSVVIIDDVRFPNEAEMIINHKGIVLYIDRTFNTIENAGIKQHESEHDLPGSLITEKFTNDGTVDDLLNKVKCYISTYNFL